MLIGYACNADRYEDWITNPKPLQNASHGILTPPLNVIPGYPQNPLERDTVGNYFVTGQIQDAIATHTASDIVLSAMGRHAAVFGGVMDNTDVFFKVMQVALGDAALRQELIDRIGNPGIVGINGVSAGGASLALQGSSGGQYALQATTDFQTWSNLFTTNNLPSTFLDTNAPVFAYRFYRLKWQ